MKKILFIISIFSCAFAMNAQPLAGRHTTGQKIEAGDSNFEMKAWTEALKWYKDASDEDPKNLYLDYRMALCNYYLRDYIKSDMLFTKVLRKDEKSKDDNNDYSDVPFKLARVKKMQEKYEEAIPILEKILMTTTDANLKKLATAELDGAKAAKSMNQDELLKIDNAGNDVNCPDKDFSPAMGKNGELYYISTRQNGAVVIDGKKNDYFGNVMMATNDGKGNFTNAKALDQVINREAVHTTYVSFSPSGNRMYFTRAEVTGQAVSTSKLFMSVKSGNGWGAAMEIKGINGNVMHPCAGELFGKEVLFFTSNMEGTKGETDIFYATKKTDDTYELPVNLGDVINTPGEEYTPFYKDGKLYFSSTGHPGMGGFDVFVSSFDGTGFSKPVNIGKGYNSPQDDYAFVIDAKNKGFLSSNRTGTAATPLGTKIKGFPASCCDDIYSANMEEMKVSLCMDVKDKSKKAISNSSSQIIEMTNNSPGVTVNNANATGNLCDIPLSFDKSYMVITTKEGFYPDTLYFNTTGLKKTTVIEKKVVLRALPVDPKFIRLTRKETIKTGGSIRMNNIYYDYDDDKILPDAEGDLNALADIMTEYPTAVIELSSHTDSRGKDEYNQKLSQRRAESAVRYLIERKGIARERLQPKGYGETLILNRCTNAAKDCTDEDHRFNRRTEFKVIGGATEKDIERTITVAKKWSECTPEEKKAGVGINEDEYNKILRANAPKNK
jgi:peptidoglycan-associated lipoprotein